MAETLDTLGRKLDQILVKIDDLRQTANFALAKELLMANVLDPIPAAIASLQAQVESEVTVEQSAITLLNGLSAQVASIAAQLATAIANAADPAQVAALAGQLTSLASTVQTSSAALAAAVTANTAPTP